MTIKARGKNVSERQKSMCKGSRKKKDLGCVLRNRMEASVPGALSPFHSKREP